MGCSSFVGFLPVLLGFFDPRSDLNIAAVVLLSVLGPVRCIIFPVFLSILLQSRPFGLGVVVFTGVLRPVRGIVSRVFLDIAPPLFAFCTLGTILN